jgi:ATP-dependent Lon protease
MTTPNPLDELGLAGLLAASVPPIDAEARFDLPVLPVRNMVLFPGVAAPLDVGRERSVAALLEAVAQRPDILHEPAAIEHWLRPPEDATEEELVKWTQQIKADMEAEELRWAEWLQRARVALSREIRATASHDFPMIAIFGQRAPEVKEPKSSDLFPVGCIARVVAAFEHSSGYTVVVYGQHRVGVEEVLAEEPYLRFRLRLLKDVLPLEGQGPLASELRALAKEIVNHMVPELPRPEARRLIDASLDLGSLSDLLASTLEASTAEKAELLSVLDESERARKVIALLRRQLEAFTMG